MNQIRVVIALALTVVLTASATWAASKSGGSPVAEEVQVATKSAILAFGGSGIPNVGDLCTNFSGSSFGCEPPTPDYSTPLPRAGNLVTLLIHPIYNDAKTDLVVAVYVNNVPTTLFTVIPAGSSRTQIINANVSIAAGDLVKIVTQGFTSDNEFERMQYTGSVVYEFP